MSDTTLWDEGAGWTRGGREEAEGLMTKGRGYYYDRGWQGRREWGMGWLGVGVGGGGARWSHKSVVAAWSYSRCVLGVVEEDH